jgi:hypothetical protein
MEKAVFSTPTIASSSKRNGRTIRLLASFRCLWRIMTIIWAKCQKTKKTAEESTNTVVALFTKANLSMTCRRDNARSSTQTVIHTKAKWSMASSKVLASIFTKNRRSSMRGHGKMAIKMEEGFTPLKIM